MDLRKVKKLIELLEESSLAEMEIQSGDEHITLKRTTSVQTVNQLAPVMPLMPEYQQPAADASSENDAPASSDDQREPITAPIVGTYYEAHSPGSKPFVRIGQKVAKGDTLCIIEAMKMMNEIKAPFAGTVASIEPSNAQPVEYGQVLMYLEA